MTFFILRDVSGLFIFGNSRFKVHKKHLINKEWSFIEFGKAEIILFKIIFRINKLCVLTDCKFRHFLLEGEEEKLKTCLIIKQKAYEDEKKQIKEQTKKIPNTEINATTLRRSARLKKPPDINQH